jgi:hypothetical protein
MIRYHLLLLAIWTITIAGVGAQPPEVVVPSMSMMAKYNSEAIYLRYSTYTKNNEVFRLGVMGGGLKNEFNASPEAMLLFKKYQKQKRWSMVCSVLEVTAGVIAFSSRDRSRRTTFQITGGAISIIAVPLFIGSYNNLNKAVWFRNGALMTIN